MELRVVGIEGEVRHLQEPCYFPVAAILDLTKAVRIGTTHQVTHAQLFFPRTSSSKIPVKLGNNELAWTTGSRATVFGALK